MAERLAVFPAFHRVEGRTIVVVGEGEEAAAKVRLLGETEASIRVIAEHPLASLHDLLDSAERIEHRARRFRPEDVDGAALVFAASGDPETDASVAAAARSRNVPVNAVDRPDLCDFFMPALVNRAPVAVAIGELM